MRWGCERLSFEMPTGSRDAVPSTLAIHPCFTGRTPDFSVVPWVTPTLGRCQPGSEIPSCVPSMLYNPAPGAAQTEVFLLSLDSYLSIARKSLRLVFSRYMAPSSSFCILSQVNSGQRTFSLGTISLLTLRPHMEWGTWTLKRHLKNLYAYLGWG